jgi:NAD(P)-dependent dehydrogenase (short-subunit alcohol dehydrogenase family)
MLAAYASSKAAVINLTQSAACALAEYKITINCICPGVTKTALGNSQLSKLKEYADSGKVPVEQTHIPPALLGPTAAPEDIARMVTYLAGKGGAYITGQSINIDGGRCMH